jgi:hypothetical protein
MGLNSQKSVDKKNNIFFKIMPVRVQKNQNMGGIFEGLKKMQFDRTN